MSELSYEGDECSVYGQHKYFMVGKTYTDFTMLDSDDMQALEIDPKLLQEPLYTRTEYAILTCNCGSAIRSTVEQR